MDASREGEPSAKPSPSMVSHTTFFRYKQPHPLNAIFEPKSIAVIGATERVGSVGRTLLWNLISNPFGGTVFPINPKHGSVLGIKAYPHLAALSEQVDLAVIATPVQTVPGIMAECVATDVKGVIIISDGFKESGVAGVKMEQQILEQAHKGKMRVIGTDCLGVMSPQIGLNATYASSMARPGNVGFISQSGALCSAVLDWSLTENVGFSAVISTGSMVDVGWGDLIDYLGSDQQTTSIVIYLETIGDTRSFLSAAREVARIKPIIILKAGHTQAAAQAATTHTGVLSGSHEVFEAACRRIGVLTVNRLDELFAMAGVLAKQPRPRGPRLTILTNAGGPGILATDALLSSGGVLAELSPPTLSALDQVLPAHWSHSNPVDIQGGANPERYAKVVEIAAQDPNSDGLLVILTPQAMTDPALTAEKLKHYATTTGKPILASWMGGEKVASGNMILNQASIPTFPYPDTAARVFSYMWRYSSNLRSLYETPLPSLELGKDGPDHNSAVKLIETARQSGRTMLTAVESMQLLTAYGIPTVETRVANNESEAVKCAEEIGYPVVLKLFSDTISHKTDVGGVQLHLSGEEAVRSAYRAIEATVSDKVGAEHFQGVLVEPMISLDGYELIVGSSLDPQFGPVLLFGSGGQLVEVYRDHALALPPLTTTLARRMMEQTRVFTALEGVRGRAPIDLAALEQLLVRFSYLVVEQRQIKEIDINPLLATAGRLIALDARVVLHKPDMSEDELPKLAIRPYPLQYARPWTMNGGIAVTLRPIRPDDEPLMVKFHETLSDRSVYFRWLHMLGLSQRVAHERLIGICFIDYDREMALVAEYHNPQTEQNEIIGVGRLIKDHGENEAEFAVLISDQYQQKGLGAELMRRLIQVGHDEKYLRLTGDIDPENQGMQQICRQLGFRLQYSLEEQLMKAVLVL